MAQPINYLGMMPQQPDIGRSLLSGLQAGSVFREMRQQELAAQQAEQAKQQYAADLQATFANPTPQAFASLSAKYPQQREAFKQSWDMLNKDQQDSEFISGAQAFNALNAGNVEAAKGLLDRRISAMANAGQNPAKLQSMRDALEGGDVKAVQANLGFVLSAVDPDRWDKMTKTAAEQQIRPLKFRQESADAIIKEAQAKFAPEKFGLEIDLTKSQIEQAKAARRAQDAAARASGAAAARAEAEANQIASGIIPADKRPEAENKFRKEYSDQTKGYQEVKSAYGRVLASEDSAVGDLSLIFGYMKMLDPGSVVREGEFATAQNAAGVPERIQNIYNKVVNGERLSPSQRTSFKGQAGKLYSTAQTQEATVRQGIERIAKGYGLNTGNIFYEATETPPPGAGAAPPAAGGGRGAPVSVTAPNGQVLTFPSQQAADAFKKAAGIR
jgi:hypothetical protein